MTQLQPKLHISKKDNAGKCLAQKPDLNTMDSSKQLDRPFICLEILMQKAQHKSVDM